MSNYHLQLASTVEPRIDGINVAQLLHDLGEASATTSAVDLFGLCLNAQRVLAHLHVDAVGTSPDESALLAAFRTMDDSARSDMLPVMRSIAEQFPQRPPMVLTLVQVNMI
jgi:hypothetical protein